MTTASSSSGEKRPAVSVIVPAYNVTWCVRDALDSVAAQTFDDFEVVVVNDGSTDETEAVVNDYLSDGILPRARLITQENRRLGGARNTGIRESIGELVAFLDADDLWYPAKLEEVVSTFSSLPPEFGLVCHDELMTRNGAKVGVNRNGPWRRHMYRWLLHHGPCLSPSTVTVRRSVLERVGGFSEDPNFHSIEDYDLWLRLSLETKFHFSHKVLGERRLHDTSLGSQLAYNVHNELAVLDVHFKKYYSSRITKRGPTVSIRRRKQVVHRRAARRYLAQGDRAAAMASLMTAMRLYPLAPKAWALLAIMAVNGRRLLPGIGLR